MINVRKTFVPLKPLDLRECITVNDVVSGMESCSLGARMLGEVATTLYKWICNSKQPAVIIYAGAYPTPLSATLQHWVGRGWFSDVLQPEQLQRKNQFPRALVVGNFTEPQAEKIYRSVRRGVFINEFGLAKPGQFRDGYFPDVLFSDPRYIIPILNAALWERDLGIPTTCAELFAELPECGGLAAEVAEGASVLEQMLQDPKMKIAWTFSGTMTVSQMGLVICDIIDLGFADLISSTGALMAHGMAESMGHPHFKYNPRHSDKLLAAQSINRVTDTLEPEENFDHIDELMTESLNRLAGERRMRISPSMLHAKIGEVLAEKYPAERGILKSAYEMGVPVMVPAFVDSELGNDVCVHNDMRANERMDQFVIDCELDSRMLRDFATKAKRIGIFTIGGGVPRNNVQNVAPLIEITNGRTGWHLPERQFRNGCRIDPTPLWFGNLSGCTYSEGGSWRKMDLENGRFAEVHADATLVLPFIIRYIMEQLGM